MTDSDDTAPRDPTPSQVDTDLADVFSRDATNQAVVVLDGAGVRLTVRYGRLVAEDGLGRHRRSRRWTRALAPTRVVILAGTGMVSLDALGWCEALGTEVIVIDDRDGRVRFANSGQPSKGDGRLRRAQAAAGLADDHPVGVSIVRGLLNGKLVGEAALARSVLGADNHAETIEALASALEEAQGIEECRQLEASAAAAYFAAWTGHPATVARFADKDLPRVPEHWTYYDGRRSLLGAGNSNRKAINPTNALLNYLFALARAEAVLSCRIVGLDPDLGLLHLDMAGGRPSMALDVIEPLRPSIERYVLGVLETRTFRRGEFVEQADGSCRLGAGPRSELAATMPRWAKEVAPYVESVARSLGELIATDFRTTAPLSGAKRKSAQRRVKARKAASGATRLRMAAPRMQRPGKAQLGLALWTCPDCGGHVEDGHVRCDQCIASDPAQAPEIRGRRGTAIASRKRRQAEWEAANPGARYDPDLFRRDIMPRLAEVKLGAIVEVTGYSKAHASDIRRGRWTPHISTWAELARLVGVTPPQPPSQAPSSLKPRSRQ